MRRVAVTGLGAVSPNGIGKEAFWDACINGRSGVDMIRRFDASGLPVRWAAEVMDFDVLPFLPEPHRKSAKIMSRATQFAVGAAGLAVADSGLALDAEDPERIGVVMGTGLVPMDMAELAAALAASCDESGRLDLAAFGRHVAQSLYPLGLLKYPRTRRWSCGAARDASALPSRVRP